MFIRVKNIKRVPKHRHDQIPLKFVLMIFVIIKEVLLILYIYFFLNIFCYYAITVVPFPPLHSPLPCTPPPAHIPPLQFMSMGFTFEFFGFYISYTILTLSLSIFYLPFMLLILCTFPPLSPFHCPVPNPACDLHFCVSVPVLVVGLICFCFCFRCGC